MGKRVWKEEEGAGEGMVRRTVSSLRFKRVQGWEFYAPILRILGGQRKGEGSMPVSKPTRQIPSMEDQGESSIYSALPGPVQATGCPQSWQPLALSVLATVALVSFRGWLKCSSELRIKSEREPKGTVPTLPFPLPSCHIKGNISSLEK